MKIYYIVAETLCTDGEYFSEVYFESTPQRAGEFASSLVANMCETMGVDCVDATSTWEIGNDDWFYRVRTEEVEL